MRSQWSGASVLAALAITLAGCGSADDGSGEAAALAAPAGAAVNGRTAFAAVDEARLRGAGGEPEQWMTYGGNYEEQRFSRLDQIHAGNVERLSLAWFADFDINLTQQSTPLAVDGVIYVTTAWSKVNAYDAVTGEHLWHFDPEVPGEQGAFGCCNVVNRGAAMWNGKIFVGAYDGRLIAIDAETGEQVWSTMTVDHDWYSITGAPRVVKGLVVIGNGGAELGVRGYVTAYDAETGDKVWRFYTVPGNPADGPDGEISDGPLAELAADTWNGEFWTLGGGGTVWDSIIYDPELDLLYLGVGNGSPWNASLRSPGGGDNLFLTSIVAVRPETGEYVWHYQQNPWESWDYTATQPMMIADLDFDGETRRVIMQAPKNGFFYVLDAATGEFISAEPFVQNITWAEGIDPETGVPIENPAARYDVVGEPFLLAPGPQGARSWNPWSHHPGTGLVYFPARETSMPYLALDHPGFGIFNVGVDWTSAGYLYDEPDNEIPRGMSARLAAWDPVRQQEVWSQPLTGTGSGTLSTAGGLVFTGSGQELVAFSAEDGERLWSFPTQAGMVAGAISFAVDGEQYIAQVVGSGSPGGYYSWNHSRLLVFKLDGEAELPPPTPPVQLTLDPPPAEADETLVERGQQAYGQACAGCHGTSGGNSNGRFPDVRYSPALWSQDLFDMIVLDGQRAADGMPGFADSIGREESEAMRAYITQLANQLVTQQAGAGQ